jgi:hypothetical protein
MSSAFAFPYKTIPAEMCLFGEWERIDANDDAEPIGDHVAGWDYDSDMKLARSVQLNPGSIMEELGLDRSDARMSIVVTAETGPTSYRWIVSRTDVPEKDRWQADLHVHLKSVHLAQRLCLATEVVLATKVLKAKPFTAKDLGSRLYRDVTVIQLEGSLGRFPMDMLDFGKNLPFLRAQDALWYLDWDPSRPESQFLGTVLLYINSSHAEVSSLMRGGEPTLLGILRCDVIRAMSEALLHNDEFVSNYLDFEIDTVGGQVREWLMIAFGDEKPELLRSKLDSSPGRFEAQIQSAFS